jgi:hypothetical protein
MSANKCSGATTSARGTPAKQQYRVVAVVVVVAIIVDAAAPVAGAAALVVAEAGADAAVEDDDDDDEAGGGAMFSLTFCTRPVHTRICKISCTKLLLLLPGNAADVDAADDVVL